MADRPILFSAPMVRALLAGTKTQTRRVMKPQPFESGYFDGDIELTVIPANDQWPKAFRFNADAVGGDAILGEIFEPRISVGDRLYVREAWRTTYGLDWAAEELGRPLKPREFDPKTTAIEYLADGDRELAGKDRRAMHMPRWASRLTLTVTGVKVERLQDISPYDAEAEGCPPCPACNDVGWINSGPDGGWQCTEVGCGDAYVDQYARLWDRINGKGAWEANPWVTAYTFSVQHGNIDQIAKVAA